MNDIIAGSSSSQKSAHPESAAWQVDNSLNAGFQQNIDEMLFYI